jgi:hypothetical protein
MSKKAPRDVSSVLQKERLRLWNRLGQLGGDCLLLYPALQASGTDQRELYEVLRDALDRMAKVEQAMGKLEAVMSRHLH